MRLWPNSLLVLLCATVMACGLRDTSNAASGVRTTPERTPLAPASGQLDAEMAAPAGFPSEVPVYPGARLTAGASFTSPGQVTWGMEWESLDPVEKVRAFYARQLAQGDWTSTFSDGGSGGFSATFSRKGARLSGIVGADGSSGVTKISMSLVSSGWPH